MKKLILFAAILFAGVSVAMAQGAIPPATPANATDNVTLNVNLHPIQTLFINPTQKSVDLEYNLN